MKTLLAFQDLTFESRPDGARVFFLKSFYFDLKDAELAAIGPYEIEDGALSFDLPERSARAKFGFLLEKGLQHLYNRYTQKPAFYIHQGSGIPLIGCQAFGIIDRNTSIIEVRPLTGCNLNCVYCSVDEGLSTKKTADYVVEKDYLVAEFKKIVAFKECDHLEAHIGTQGDPTLYGPLPELVADLAAIPQVKEIAMDTNGMLLTEEIVDKLAAAGMTRINLSINAMDPVLAKRIAGYGKYDIEHAKRIAAYAAKKMTLLIAPVLVGKLNVEEMQKIISFAQQIGAKVGIQNFLNYKYGRNPDSQIPWDDFYKLLQEWEASTGQKLMLRKEDFHITYTKKLPKPFKKNDIIEARIVGPGRLPGEVLAVCGERALTVRNCERTEGTVRVKLDRSKHNIFIGHVG